MGHKMKMTLKPTMKQMRITHRTIMKMSQRMRQWMIHKIPKAEGLLLFRPKVLSVLKMEQIKMRLKMIHKIKIKQMKHKMIRKMW